MLMIGNEESLGLGLSVGQKKQSEDIILGSGKVWLSIFDIFFTFYRVKYD